MPMLLLSCNALTISDMPSMLTLMYDRSAVGWVGMRPGLPRIASPCRYISAARRCVCSTVVLAGAPVCNEHLTRTALNGGFLVVRSAISNFFSISFFGYKLHARSLVQFARLLKDEESARDNHALACNFARYSPIERTFSLTDSAINRS